MRIRNLASVRNWSKPLKTFSIRNSITVGAKKTWLRFFVHWKKTWVQTNGGVGPPTQLCGIICTYHPAAAGSNPKHTFYALFNLYYRNCNEKRMKISKNRPGLAHLKNKWWWVHLRLVQTTYKSTVTRDKNSVLRIIIKFSNYLQSIKLVVGRSRFAACLNELLFRLLGKTLTL